MTRSVSPTYLLICLCALYALSYVDRTILSVLAAPIAQAFGIGDIGLGAIIGTGFALVYAFVGIPLAHALDRGPRMIITAAGVLVWSVMTVASSLASNPAELALCRAGVAVGEAVLTPAAISLIADGFGREHSIVPTALYSSIATVMGASSLIVGTALLALAERIAPAFGVAPWRMTLVMVGLPGLLLAPLFLLTVAEPKREQNHIAHEETATFRDFLRFVRQRAGFYVPLYAALGGISTYFMGLTTWLPAILSRSFDLTPAISSALMGATVIPASLAAAVIWPWTARRLLRRWPRAGMMTCYLGALSLGAPFMILGPFATSARLMAIALSLAIFATLVIGSLPGITIQHHSPPRFRARLMAVVLLMGGLLGYCGGALLVPLLGRLWPGPADGLPHGLTLLGLLTIPVILPCLELARRQAVID